MTDDPLVTVVVPVRDGAAHLPACLAALNDQQGAPRFEVVVVDNGSTDSSAELARSAGARVVPEPRPGSYAARNAGARQARGALLAFTDADCVPAPDWVMQGARALAAAPVVGGDVRMLRHPGDGVLARYDRALYLRQRELVEQQGYAATADLWVRREAFAAVGEFAAELRSSGDLEWGRRASAAGRPAVFAPEVVVEHAPRRTVRDTWMLHRRLGAGWTVLAGRGQWPGLVADRAWRLPLGLVVDLVGADGPPLRRRQLAPVHLLAMTARLVGRVTGR